jgi:hypothetical protein
MLFEIPMRSKASSANDYLQDSRGIANKSCSKWMLSCRQLLNILKIGLNSSLKIPRLINPHKADIYVGSTALLIYIYIMFLDVLLDVYTYLIDVEYKHRVKY